MMLVSECAPGDIVETVGWDIAIAVTHSSTPHVVNLKTAYLIPARLDEPEAVSSIMLSIDMSKKRTMLYVGPVWSTKLDTKQLDLPHGRKTHHFLTDQGESIGLHGSEFKYINICKP
jgi:hypothetical protein